jgi:hypothetical protein
MNWKKTLITFTIINMLIFTAVGCNNAGSSTEDGSATSLAVQTDGADNNGNNIPAEGAGFSDNGTGRFQPSDNGTMSVPPGGEFRQEPAMLDIDWAAAAAALGVTEDTLKEAVGDLSAGRPDFAAIAVKLGITEQQLMEALGFKGGNMTPGGESRQVPSLKGESTTN